MPQSQIQPTAYPQFPLPPYQQFPPSFPSMFYPSTNPYPWIQSQQPSSTTNQVSQTPTINVMVNSPGKEDSPVRKKESPETESGPEEQPRSRPRREPSAALSLPNLLALIESKIDEAGEQVRSGKMPMHLLSKIAGLAKKVEVHAGSDGLNPEIAEMISDLIRQLKELTELERSVLKDKFERRAGDIFQLIEEVHEKQRIHDFALKKRKKKHPIDQVKVPGERRDPEILGELAKLQSSLQQANLKPAIASLQ
jgi:hypothetical protein